MKKIVDSVSVVIPVYNERRTIKKLLKRVSDAPTLGLKKEIIVVDDGSSDGTTDIIRRVRLPGLIKIFKKVNQGKGSALIDGFARARADIVIVQDADLEYNPDDYPLLLQPFLSQGVSAVYGSRELTINTHSYPVYFLGGRMVTMVTRLLYGGRLTDVPTGYKAIRRSVLAKIPLSSQRFDFCPELTAYLLLHKYPIVEVPIRYSPRRLEDGKKIRWRDGIEAIWTLLSIRLRTL